MILKVRRRGRRKVTDLERIASFNVDHTKLNKGIYVSRIDGDITSYDLRMKKPNKEPVLGNGAVHTIEHLFATYVRNSDYKNSVIYFGPMGCRTGFYFLVRNADDEKVLKLTTAAFEFIKNYVGVIPGSSEVECGNYLDHNLPVAKAEAEAYYNILKNSDDKSMKY